MGNPKLPKHLINEIRHGNCVAFVGAGFSAPAVPDWDSLLFKISAHTAVGKETRSRIEQLMGSERTSLRGVFDREAAAQILRARLGTDFDEVLNDIVRKNTDHGSAVVDERKKLLYEIPFQSILTTNFDHMLSGTMANPDVYRKSLRTTREPWFNLFSWDTGERLSEVIKLHGDIDSNEQGSSGVVLTRSDYRKLLFEDSRYSNFLKAMLATRTVLFLGFSFSDGYLNLLRSEVLALLNQVADEPLAYAVLDNVDSQEADFLSEHEGIHALVYDSDNGNHSGFDNYLKAIHDETAPTRIIGRLLENKTLLWLDPNPDNNIYGKKIIRRSAGTDCEIVECSDPDRALRYLSERRFDLLITHWGHGLLKDRSGQARSNGVEVLEGIRARNVPVPVIVFASPDTRYAGQNRTKALSLGAFDYTWTFEDLFKAIEQIFQ